MSSYEQILVERFREKGILVDTNLLLLYLVGKFDLSIIANGSFKRTNTYDPEAFRLLVQFLGLFKTAVTTPHILAEVSNLMGQLGDQAIACRDRFLSIFQILTELPISSSQAASNECFRFVGLTDATIAEFADQYLVITEDARLLGHLNRIGFEGLNFTHLRQAALQRKVV